MNLIWEIVPYTRGRGIEVNSDTRAFPHFMRADPECVKAQSLDFVFCRDFTGTMPVTDWWRLVKHGGHLVLIGEDASALLDHYVQVRREETAEGLFQVYVRKASGGRHVNLEHIPEKSVAVVRLGAYGDAIQASSILPELKRQGYHVTFYTQPIGYEVLKHDPHIDRFYVQEPNQVPHELLLEFWNHEKAKYSRWINLSESVEGSLLVSADRAQFDWPHELRHAVCDHNYLERTHAIAGVAFEPRAKFYATADERAWAQKQMAKAGVAIVFSLSGSSIHKVWPHMDAIIARVMLESTTAKVVLVGAASDAHLQAPWANEPRVWRKAGEWSMREAMAFAEASDLVIGSETGLLNAVGLADVPKIVCLSHSSVENLTKHWKNTTSLIPPVGCYPCHRMIHRWEHCNRDEETGVALCQAKIDVTTMWLAIQEVFRTKRMAA